MPTCVRVRCPVCRKTRQVARATVGHSPAYVQNAVKCVPCARAGKPDPNVPDDADRAPETHPGVGNDRPLPPEPTQATPGSPLKVTIMRTRYLKGRHIHHPGDVNHLSNLSRFRLWLEALAAVDRDVADRLNGADSDDEIEPDL